MEGVFGGVVIAEDPPADAEDERTVSPDKEFKSPGVAVFGAAGQECGVGGELVLAERTEVSGQAAGNTGSSRGSGDKRTR